MKIAKLIPSFFLATSLSLFANDTYSKQRLESFFDDFSCEQKDELFDAGLSDPCSDQSSNVNPPPPHGPVLPPAPVSGRLPFVIVNSTGLPASDVYLTVFGNQSTGTTIYLFELDKNNTGFFNPVAASDTTYSPTFAVKLSDLPRSSTGTNEYLIYLPDMIGGRLYFSINQPMYFQTDSGSPNNLAAPTFFAFYDPNYSNLYESVEVTFKPTGGTGGPGTIPWTATVNTTEVDAFCLPINLALNSFDPSNPNAITPLVQNPNALPSGFASSRKTILDSVTMGLSSGDKTGATPKVWPRLALPFYTNPYNATGMQTYLRVLSPKQSVGNAAGAVDGGIDAGHLANVNGTGTATFQNYNYPAFPMDYFSSTAYGNSSSFADELFSHYTGGTMLYINTAPATTVSGSTSGSSGSYVLAFSDGSSLSQSDLNVFSMYSGTQPFSPAGTDAAALTNIFSSVFTVGILPSAVGTMMADPIDIGETTPGGWVQTNIGDYYKPENSAVAGGPWESLYAHELHKVAVSNTVTTPPTFSDGVGLCYGYDFDDSLQQSGAMTPAATTADTLNPYYRLTLESIDTGIPDPYSDTNTYDVTFTIPAGHTLQVQQGNGPKMSVTSGVPVTGLVSNSQNPLRMFFDKSDMSAQTEFIIYLYYQFFVPQNKYTSVETAVINGAPIVPNSPTPTSFSIALPPL